MMDVDVPEDRLRDPARFYSEGRDPERTPMQWDSTEGRGFTTGEPWLPYGPADISAAAQRQDPTSMLTLQRRAIWLRKRLPALLRGGYREVESPEDVFVFERRVPGEDAVWVAVNTAIEICAVSVPQGAEVILSTGSVAEAVISSTTLQLPPLAAVWLRTR